MIDLFTFQLKFLSKINSCSLYAVAILRISREFEQYHYSWNSITTLLRLILGVNDISWEKNYRTVQVECTTEPRKALLYNGDTHYFKFYW